MGTVSGAGFSSFVFQPALATAPNLLAHTSNSSCYYGANLVDSGPLVGGFAAQHKGWQWPIWELLWLSGFALVCMIIFLPETSSMNILYRRTRRLRKLTGRSDLRSEGELMSEQMTGKEIALMTLVRPFTLTFTEPILFLLNLYIALIYGLLYVWFESFAIVFLEIYHFNLGEEGLSFVGILVYEKTSSPSSDC
jgi:DHA1 family multidrug resistance protein-like MFS transporter